MKLEGKHVLVTGGAGFLGKNVREALRKRNPAAVYIPRKAVWDLTYQARTRQIFGMRTEIDIAIHLAASVGGIGANRLNPGKYFYENAMMGMNVMEAAREFKVEKFVDVGTICSYPKHTPVPFREADLWNGYPEETNAPYGIAKKAVMAMGQAYRQQYGMNVITILPVNLYGPGDNFDGGGTTPSPHSFGKCSRLATKEGRTSMSGEPGGPRGNSCS